MNLAVEVVLAWLLIVAGAVWLTRSGWVLVVGGVILLVAQMAMSDRFMR